MKEVSSHQLKSGASKLAAAGKKWHFHLLTQECLFNKTSKYALILECATENTALVYYSESADKGLSKELAQLLHGKDVFNIQSDASPKKPSKSAEKIIKRANKITKRGDKWHHHLFFPDCTFNQHKPSWVLVLEDRVDDQVVESLSDKEPVGDLKIIENLFYGQKKL